MPGKEFDRAVDGRLLESVGCESVGTRLLSDAFSSVKRCFKQERSTEMAMIGLPLLGAIITRKPGFARRAAGEVAELELTATASVMNAPRNIARLESNWQSVSTELRESWLKHNMELLSLDSTEDALLRSALKEGGVKFTLLDKQFLHAERIFARDAIRTNVQRELSSAANYDPLKANQAVLICRVPGERFDQFHIINGNNRVHLFGSTATNPKDAQLPAFIFDSPREFERILNYDVLTNMAKARPLHLY